MSKLAQPTAHYDVVEEDQPPPYYRDTPSSSARPSVSSPFQRRAAAAREASLDLVCEEAYRIIHDNADHSASTHQVILILPQRAEEKSAGSTQTEKGSSISYQQHNVETFGPGVHGSAQVVFLTGAAGTSTIWQQGYLLKELKDRLRVRLLEYFYGFPGEYDEPHLARFSITVTTHEVHCRSENTFGLFETVDRSALIVDLTM